MELQRNLIRLLKSRNFLTLFRRTYTSDSDDFHNELITVGKVENKKKGKVSVIVKSFNNDLKNSVILEAKDASTVVKNLNWEFKMLYGSLQAPKRPNVSRNGIKTLNNTDHIIQNRSVFPILEPNEDSLVQSPESKPNGDLSESNCWETLLNFPLLNNQSHALNSNLEVNETNSLRRLLEEKSKNYVPSVSKIIEKTMPQQQAENLRRWKEKMIQQLGEEGFQKYQKEMLSNGQTLHTSINNYLGNVPRSEIEIEETIAGHWESLKAVFPCVSDIKLLEERLTHPFLRYKGIVDCFARYKGSLVVIEWKTSKKKKFSLSSTFDNPLQIAAYVGALNFDPKYQYLANKGLIVVSYPDGSNASTHFMDESVMMRYWKEWLARVKLYWELTEKEENLQS